jgi:hypothetical protein
MNAACPSEMSANILFVYSQSMIATSANYYFDNLQAFGALDTIQAYM